MRLTGYALVDDEWRIRDEILIFPRGQFSHPEYGLMTFDSGFFARVQDNFNRRVLGVEPFIDFEHKESEAAGWIKSLRETGAGLMATVEWTKLGRQALTDKIFRYFSPWWGAYATEKGEQFSDVLRGGALTNVPFLKTSLPALVAQEPKALRAAGVDLKLSDFAPTIERPADKIRAYLDDHADADLDALAEAIVAMINEMKSKPKEIEMDQIALAKELGLPEDSPPEQILEAVRAGKAASIKLAEAKPADDAKLAEREARIVAIEAKLADTTKRAADAEKKLAEREANERVAQAIRDGKLTPAMAGTPEKPGFYRKLALSDPSGFAEAIGAMPRLWSPGEMGSALDNDLGSLSVEQQIMKLAEAKVAESKDGKLRLPDAITIVKTERPDLAAAYLGKGA